MMHIEVLRKQVRNYIDNADEKSLKKVQAIFETSSADTDEDTDNGQLHVD